MYPNKGFILPLTLMVMVIILVVALWANRNVIFDLWTTVVQKESAEEFYSAEAGIHWAIASLLYTSTVDKLSQNQTLSVQIPIPIGKKTIPVTITIKFLRISTDCNFKTTCCRLFEIKAQVTNAGYSSSTVKIIGIKDIPNPEQDEEAKSICM